MKTLTVLFISLTIVRILLGDIPFMKVWWVDMVLLAGLILLVGIHSVAIRKVIERRRIAKQKKPQWQGTPEVQLISDEDFQVLRHRIALGNPLRCLWVSRESRVALLRCAPPALLATVFLGCSAFLAFKHPSITFDYPNRDIGGWKAHSIHLTLKVWEIPLLLSLRVYYAAVKNWQRWKWMKIWNITEKEFSERKEESKLFPEEGREDVHRIPTDQITEVRSEVKYWGGILGGFGNVYIEVRISEEQDRISRVVDLRRVPQAERFADLLRSVSRAGGVSRGGLSSNGIPGETKLITATESVKDVVLGKDKEVTGEFPAGQ